MSSKKSVKCKICGRKYVSKQALIDHIEKAHSDSIPEGWNAARYENFLRTGKTEGHCVYCKKETGWNNATWKYNRMCGSEECKKAARELANKNYIGLHGKPYSINNPEQQKKMVYGRKNSGTYIFEDEETGKKYKAMYDSSYGKDFFEMLDMFLNWDGSDIIAPSPHTYYYEYEGKKHFYIPDAYSTSLNLEKEFKDGGDNPNKHPKIQAVDKVKEQKKDEVMKSLKGQVNYIKICNKDYSEFFALLSELREQDECQLPKWESKLESVSEGYGVITESKEDDTYYRVTYNGEGIYEALRKTISEDEWKIFLNSYSAKWLPKPNVYPEDARSLFTKYGIRMFKKHTLPYMRKYLDNEKIKIEELKYDYVNPIYSDEYQIVVSGYVTEGYGIITESKKTDKLYFVSRVSMNDDLLTPSIPDNYFTKSGYEDNKTPRVCFAPSIDQCLMALSQNIEGLEFYVHVPEDEQNVVYPTEKQVPDCKITGEVWVTNPVTLRCIGKIKVDKSVGDGVEFTYGDKTAMLYKWKWHWVSQWVEESTVNADVDIDTVIFDFGAVLDINMSDEKIYEYYETYMKPDGITENEFLALKKDYYDYTDDVDNESLSYEALLRLYEAHVDEKYRKYVKDMIDIYTDSIQLQDYVVPMLDYLTDMGYKIYYLSNQSRYCWDKHSYIYDPIMHYFIDGIISYKVDLVKPDIRIYKLLIEKTGLNPNSSIFFDDRENNVEASIQAGIYAERFTRETVERIMNLPRVGNVETGVIESSSNPYKGLIKRDYQLKNPTLNYDDLILYYRNQIFHKKLTELEWQCTYNELINVRGYLKKVINKGRGEYDERMCYEAKKALKQVNNFIQYMEEENKRKKPVTEKMDTFLTTNPFEKQLTLYHGSHYGGKLDVIQPVSRNVGNKFNDPRCSSFWTTNKQLAINFAIFKLVGELCDIDVCYSMDGSIYTMKKISESEVINKLKNEKVYVYTKTIDKKWVGRGHAPHMDEYTIDVPVKPDKYEEFDSSYIKDNIKGRIKYIGTDDPKEQMKIIDKMIGEGNSKYPFRTLFIFHNGETYTRLQKEVRGLQKGVSESATESKTNQNCVIISCFAGVGKNYAIEYFKKKGLVVNSLEKERDFYKIHKNPETDVAKHIHELSKKSDILFIPYYLEMEARHLNGQVDYYLVYPRLSEKRAFIKRFKELGFSDDQVRYLSENWEAMISDCDNCNIPEDRKISINRDTYLTDVIETQILGTTVSESVAMESTDYKNYMISGDYDYIKHRLESMVSPVKYTSMDDVFNINYGIPKNMDKSTVEQQVDSVGEKIYKKYWKNNRGTKANAYSPFKFYSECTNPESYARIYNKYKYATPFKKPYLYFYNFEKGGRRYSVVIVMNDKDYSIYLVYRHDLIDVSVHQPITECLDALSESITMESNSKSTLDKNFKKKSGGNFEFIDLHDPRAKKYLSTDAVYKKYFENIHSIVNGEIVIDKDKDKLAGYIYVGGGNKSENRNYGFIQTLEVRKEYRGYGLSDRLLNDAIRKYNAVDLTVYKDNEVALNLYKKHGFVIIGYGNTKDNSDYWMKLKTKLSKDDKILNESVAMESTHSDKVPVYIVSWNYDSVIGVGAKVVTGSLYNHTSVSLTPDLEECYAFSRLPENLGDNPGGGFCREKLSYMVRKHKNARIKVDAVYVSRKTYDKMKKLIKEYEKHQADTKFDYMDFVRIILGIEDNDLNDKNLVCSVFVDHLFKSSGFDLTNGKKSNLVTPADLSMVDKNHNNIVTVYSGKAVDYDKRKIGRISFESTLIGHKDIFEPGDFAEYAKYADLDSAREEIEESTHIEGERDGEKRFPVFVFLTYTDTKMAKLIKDFTHDPYTHSSLSFDTNLDNMLSFDARGFIKENIHTDVYKKKLNDVKYSLYMYMASDKEYRSMHSFIDELNEHKKKLHYNVLGLTNFIFGRGSEREDRFFCSEFVSACIQAGNEGLIKTKSYLTTPYMLAKNKNFQFIKRGTLKNYNVKEIDNIVKSKLEEWGYTNVKLN